MQTERRDTHHHRPRGSDCDRDELPHMPLGSREVPMLAHEHPPLNFARQHNADVPHHGDPGYEHYQASRAVALSNGFENLKHEMSARSPVQLLILENASLTVRYHSQSKLSQQELADLQKATHFDKKELQQWYKGTGLQMHARAARD
jgi:neuronal calcium sensor 1